MPLNPKETIPAIKITIDNRDPGRNVDDKALFD